MHDEKDVVFRFVNVVKRNDVWVIDLSQDADFGLDHTLFANTERLVDDLDRYFLSTAAVLGLLHFGKCAPKYDSSSTFNLSFPKFKKGYFPRV